MTLDEMRRPGPTGVGILDEILDHPCRSGALADSWFERKLGLEGHSREHHFGLAATTADHQRDVELAIEGWEIIYITWAMAQDPPALAASIAAIYRRRQSQLGLVHARAPITGV